MLRGVGAVGAKIESVPFTFTFEIGYGDVMSTTKMWILIIFWHLQEKENIFY